MKMTLKQIERRFETEKQALLRDLERVEKRKRARVTHISRELDVYKKKEAALKQVENAASAHLRAMSTKIETMRRQEHEDRKHIRELAAEMRRLHREVPRIRITLRGIKPVYRTVSAREKTISKKLFMVSSKVQEIERKRQSLQNDLESLLGKESMLRQGKIYWAANAPPRPSLFGGAGKKHVVHSRRTKARPARTTRPTKQPSFLDELFRKK